MSESYMRQETEYNRDTDESSKGDKMMDRTLSMMTYEDWRPKLTPQVIQHMYLAQNAYPHNLTGMGLQQAMPSQNFLNGLIGGALQGVTMPVVGKDRS